MATEQSGPNLQPGCVYRSSNLIASLRISSNTLKAWRKGPNGLKPLCEDGLKAPLFLADDVIAFLERRRGSSTSEKTSKAHPPRLRLGEVYTQGELVHNLRVGDKTFADWKRAGLRPLIGDGTNAAYYLTDDLIAFWKAQRGKDRGRSER